MSRPNYKVSTKVTLIGHADAGKSAIRLRVAENKFSAEYMTTIGVDLGITSSKDGKIKFQIWDTAGNEDYLDIAKSYLPGSRLLGLVVDLTNIAESLSFFKHYRNSIDWIGNAEIEYVVIYTKSDLDKAGALTPNTIENHCAQIAVNLGITRDQIKQHFITSAKSGKGCDTMIQAFADLVMPPLAPALNPDRSYVKVKPPTAPTSSRGFFASFFGKESNNTTTSTKQPPPSIEYQF